MPGNEARETTRIEFRDVIPGNEARDGNEATSFYSTHAYLLLYIMHMHLLRPATALACTLDSLPNTPSASFLLGVCRLTREERGGETAIVGLKGNKCY